MSEPKHGIHMAHDHLKCGVVSQSLLDLDQWGAAWFTGKGERLQGSGPDLGSEGGVVGLGGVGDRTHEKLLENSGRKLFIRKPVWVSVTMVTLSRMWGSA